MNADKRRTLVDLANDVGYVSRRIGAPMLTVASGATAIAAWLQWCDPNGCHTAELARANDMDPYDDDRAWEALDDMLRDD